MKKLLPLVMLSILLAGTCKSQFSEEAAGWRSVDLSLAGSEYITLGKYELALKRLKEGLKLTYIEGSQNSFVCSTILADLAECYYYLNYDSCLHYVMMGKNQYLKNFSPRDPERIFLLLGLNHQARLVYKALENSVELGKVSEENVLFATDTKYYVRELEELFKYYQSQSEYKKAEGVASMIIDQVKLSGIDSTQILKGIFSIAYAFSKENENRKALKFYRYCKNYNVEDCDLASVNYWISRCYFRMGKCRKALKNGRQSLEYAISCGDSINGARSMLLLGDLFSYYGDKKRSVDSYKKGYMLLSDQAKLNYPEFDSLINVLGELAIEANDTAEAAKYRRDHLMIRGHSSHFGLGIGLSKRNDTLTVKEFFYQSCGRKSGLEIGDKILRINDIPVSGNGTSIKQCINYMKAKMSQSINLLILRKDTISEFFVERCEYFTR